MLRHALTTLLASAMLVAHVGLAAADGIRVSPISLDIAAPGASGTLTLRNDGRTPMTLQSRSFSWVQSNGRETLQRTSDVQVSPPAIRLAPGATQTIRIVRTSRSPVRGEEAYRVVINEVPDQARRRENTVGFTTELRIPVFFAAPNAQQPNVAWSLRNSGNATVLVAQNRGDRRLQLASLRLSGANGATVTRDGLVGYVLGGSTMQWAVAPAGRLSGGARLRATTNVGAIDARVGAQ